MDEQEKKRKFAIKAAAYSGGGIALVGLIAQSTPVMGLGALVAGAAGVVFAKDKQKEIAKKKADSETWIIEFRAVLDPIKRALGPVMPSDSTEIRVEMKLLTVDGKPTGFRYRIVDSAGNPKNVTGNAELNTAVANLSKAFEQRGYPVRQFLFEGEREPGGLWKWEVVPFWK